MNKDKKSKENDCLDEARGFTHEDAYKTLDTINMWIGNCDTKTSVILASIGVLATVFLSSDYARIIKIIFEKTFSNLKGLIVLYAFFIVVSCVLCIAGILLFVSTITPRILREPSKKQKSTKDNGKKKTKSIMFYGLIAEKSYDEYIKEVKKETKNGKIDALMADLIYQIHSCAVICNSKFKKFKIGIILFVIGLIALCILLVFGYYGIYKL